MRSAFDALLSQAGVQPTIVAEVDDMAMLRLVARESRALTLAPPVVVVDELRTGTLVERHRLKDVKEQFFAITQRRRFPHPLVAELVQTRSQLTPLIAIVRDFVAACVASKTRRQHDLCCKLRAHITHCASSFPAVSSNAKGVIIAGIACG